MPLPAQSVLCREKWAGTFEKVGRWVNTRAALHLDLALGNPGLVLTLT